MIKNKFSLGDLDSSEKLLEDLYIGLREKLLLWAEVTKQTPQARMGYIGQHLTSIVTGYPGGMSGGRGYDLVLPNNKSAEIKTCYRVDQLGICKACRSAVSSIQDSCGACGSQNIERKDDSKWLLAVKTEKDFEDLLEPENYFFVLFEFEDLNDPSNLNIVASIWEVDPSHLGFIACLVDYKINIQGASASGAPFNLWPHMLKFELMSPKLIYRSRILETSIETLVFPGQKGEPTTAPVSPMKSHRASTTLKVANLCTFLAKEGVSYGPGINKNEALDLVEATRTHLGEEGFRLALIKCIYGPLIEPIRNQIPAKILQRAPDLSSL
jgi:hypothetical protein